MSSAALAGSRSGSKEAAFAIPSISDIDFRRFQRWLHEAAGIALADHKKTLLVGRLSKRLGPCGVRGWKDYFELLMDGSRPGELQVAIDLLTTNETYFFREPAHFTFLAEQILTRFEGSEPLRIWSAASSSGEEIYTLAMVLADTLGMGRRWEIFGSDLSTRVLETARRAHYPMTRADKIPTAFLKRFCLKGTGPQEGTFLIDRPLRERVSFAQINLNETLPDIGMFDIVFVRNVMIYFDPDTKRQVMGRILTKLKPRGHVFVSHSENLHGVTDRVDIVKPSIYRLK
ncbi:CheR family methyltransferase [Methyloversatilis sp. NSM2]|jgi:chemotaxis protein methyltransferase CheR|uniref:CheR family methyltransferase n=1 Tax=Methyloversatilis sp. NSM2 TaxID=3134135 RepID=UPI00310EAFDB